MMNQIIWSRADFFTMDGKPCCHYKAEVSHGTWFVGTQKDDCCEVAYQSNSTRTFHSEELFRAASQGEAKLLVSFYEDCDVSDKTESEVLAEAGFRNQHDVYRLSTKTAGSFSYFSVDRITDGWATLVYDTKNGLRSRMLILAKFHTQSVDKRRIDVEWPIANPRLATAIVACKLLQLRLAAGGKGYRFPVA